MDLNVDNQEFSNNETQFKWFFKDGNKWIPYSQELNQKIEDADKNGHYKVRLDDINYIDFVSMKQIRFDNNASTTVKRISFSNISKWFRQDRTNENKWIEYSEVECVEIEKSFQNGKKKHFLNNTYIDFSDPNNFVLVRINDLSNKRKIKREASPNNKITDFDLNRISELSTRAAPRLQSLKSYKQVSNIEDMINLIINIMHDNKLSKDVNYVKERLHDFFNGEGEEFSKEFLQNVFPSIAQSALNGSKSIFLNDKIELFVPRKNQMKEFSKYEVHSILSCCFLCAWSPASNLKECNFFSSYKHGSFQEERAKLLCILNYFKRTSKSVLNYLNENKETEEREKKCELEGSLKLYRRYFDKKVDWINSRAKISKLTIRTEGSMENEEGALLVDFANKFVGSGVVGSVCNQEEIIFALFPELISSIVLSPCIEENECIFFLGAEKFSKSSGYRSSFQFVGDFKDSSPRDPNGIIKRTIVAIDATDYSKLEINSQYSKKNFERELNKAYIGFHPLEDEKETLAPVSTGDWGCDTFLGDAEFKSILQILAASQAGRDIIYYSSKDFLERLKEIYKLLENKTVREVYAAFENFANSPYKKAEKSFSLSPSDFHQWEQRMGFFNFLKSYFGK